MKLMVIVADYPNTNGGKASMFVHTRNKYYIDYGIDVTVLNFAAQNNYIFEGINVITLESYKRAKNIDYDILVCHAPNIRNHYFFLKKYGMRFQKIVFFFHGHEVLKINEVYPKPFDFFGGNSKIKFFMQNLYDNFKLKVWHNYLPKIAEKSEFVFVSKHFFGEFKKYVKLTEAALLNHVHIIHNSVAKVFEEKNYCYDGDKEYDFITIRANMDDANYGVDIVNNLAKLNPDLKFLLIGKGKLFKYIKKAKNITLLNKTLNHDEMLELLNKSRCGLMPTRRDTQGVMTCEMATYGIPVITSDIPICREIFNGFKNVRLIDNDSLAVLNQEIDNLYKSVDIYKNPKYLAINTTQIECNLYLSYKSAKMNPKIYN